ncbi:MAG: recombinase family protein [Isosphaerales bacterium]
MTAFAYLRRSVDRIDDPKNPSPEAEESAIRAMAARHGDADSLVVLSDWDTSGRLAASKRPGFDALLVAIENGTCTAVYSYSMSRLARSPSELSRLFESCRARNIPIRLEADAVDTSTVSGHMTAAILASITAFEADVASERMKATRRAKREANERMGPRLYGDGPDDDPEAVLAAFREAGSFGAAARLLTERRVPVRSGKRGVWWPASVEIVVRRLDPFVLPGSVGTGVRPGPLRFTFSYLLVCPTCGTRLGGQRNTKTGRVQYVCRQGKIRPHPRSAIAEHLILPAIKAEADRLRRPDTAGLNIEDEAELARLDLKRARIIDTYTDGLIDKAERDRRLAAVVGARDRLAARDEFAAAPSIDWTRPPAELNGVLRLLFEQIDLDPLTFQPTAYAWTVPQWRSK